jgi:multiple sugar transport system substrate-binding protein
MTRAKLITCIVVLALLMAPPSAARAADLVVWWEKGFTVEEDEAVVEIVSAFEQASGQQVELAFHSYQDLPDVIAAALEAGRPPDFAFGLFLSEHIPKWAHDDRLVELSDEIAPFADMFDADALSVAMLPNARTVRRACTRCRWAARVTISTFGRAS